MNKKITANSLLNLLKKKYSKSEFIKILKINTLISTNDVINTNNCHISICETKFKNKIIILSAIDNLIKGGAGQAIQNMNIKFNLKKKWPMLRKILILFFLMSCSTPNSQNELGSDSLNFDNKLTFNEFNELLKNMLK